MSEGSSINFHYYDTEIQFNDTLVIVSHPTIGMIASITANYLIEQLDLKLVGGIHSPKLPPTSIIHKGKPLPPIRIYAGEYKDDPETDFDQLVVITSELPIENEILYELADTIIDWCKSNSATSALTIEGINRENMDLGEEAEVFHVSSTSKIDMHLEGLTKKLNQGMVSGLSGLLLYKGVIQGFPVISLLAEAHQQFPDSRSAAAVLKVLNKMVPKIELDYEPLLSHAEGIENQIRESLSQIRQGENTVLDKNASRGMYA
jgi:uncharacterized protein